MQREDEVRLRHMIEAAESAMAFARGRTRADLDTDRMLLFALARAIEIVGEAASRISEPTREVHVEVPWARIVAMRNRLIHAYFDVDRDIVWRTTAEEVPALLLVLRAALERG